MKRKEDARVVKTREKLYEAFLSLLSKKLYEQITINEICDEAGIRRATFYKHFNDKSDFSAALARALVEKFDVAMSFSSLKVTSPEYHIEYARRLIQYLVMKEDVVNLIYKSHMLPTLISIVIQQNYKVIKERLDICVANGRKLHADTDTVATALAGGVAALILKWFDEGKPTSEEHLVDTIAHMVRSCFIN